MTAGLLKRCIDALPDDAEVRIALETWADSDDPDNAEIRRQTLTVHFLEIRPRTDYTFLFLVHSDPEESAPRERSDEDDEDEKVDKRGTDWVSVNEAADLLNVSHQSVYRLIHNDGLPAYRIGKRTLRIDRMELEKWAAKKTSEPYNPTRRKAEALERHA